MFVISGLLNEHMQKKLTATIIDAREKGKDLVIYGDIAVKVYDME